MKLGKFYRQSWQQEQREAYVRQHWTPLEPILTPKRTVYEFGDFVLEGGQRLLRLDGGEPIALTAKVFDTLLRAIWPGVIVQESSFIQVISTLRPVFEEMRTENRYIATVARKGYWFVGQVTERIAAASADVTATVAPTPIASATAAPAPNPVPAFLVDEWRGGDSGVCRH